ncbi:hypothetical protein E4T48_05158 [Aureobasidium sp. EXF-10727]|nr:hypothetical protein E4T48_05158 [Aureobasidium sp. EXF-10727]
MAHSNPFQIYQPSAPPDNVTEKLCHMTTNLSIRNPYRRYPPHGVPCPDGPNTFQLNLRREKWWQMLQEYAWKEQVMMQKVRLEEQRKEREKQEKQQGTEQEVVTEQNRQRKEQGVVTEQNRQRKDSLVVGDKDVGSGDTSERGEGGGDVAAASAICDSSDEGEEDKHEGQHQQTGDIKTRKTSVAKEKEKGHKHERKARVGSEWDFFQKFCFSFRGGCQEGLPWMMMVRTATTN